MNIHSFPKVYNIGHAAIADLFKECVLVEEKIDGSQFSFAKINGELFFRSKGKEIIADAPEKMFALGVENIQSIAHLLHEGWVYRGEYLNKPKHNVLCYDRVPKHNVILFDINTGLETYLSREEKLEEAERIGLEMVALLHFAVVESPEQLLSLLDNQSVLGGQRVEGVVVKNYKRFGLDGKALMGKYVREDFKEKHSHAWKKSNPGMGDVVQNLIAALRHDKRWEKAVFHLRDRGELENSPRDIGKLIKEVQADIVSEEKEFIQEQLVKWALPKILRGASGGVAEWYKERLLKSAFDGDNVK
jgi:hypothetical protein